MKKSIILYTSMLSNIAATQQQYVGPCPPAPAGNKQALIAELVCLENHNKELILRRNQYDSLLRIIRKQDGSDCLGIRCINEGELSIKVVTDPEKTALLVEFGDGDKTRVTGGSFKDVDFSGTISTMANDSLTDVCHSKSMSYVKIINDSNNKVTIESVELRLRYPNDTYKTVFLDDNLDDKLNGLSSSLIINKESILSNPTFTTASAGSCHD